MKVYHVIAADPGASKDNPGGLVHIFGAAGGKPTIVSTLAMPLVEDKAHTFTSGAHLVDVLELRRWLVLTSDKAHPLTIVVEKSQSMPKMAVGSMFNYGTNYGRLLAALEITFAFAPRCPTITTVRPTVWKKSFGLTAGNKKASHAQTHPCLLYTSPSPRDS